MTMSHSKQTDSQRCSTFACNSDITEYRQLAAMIVDNLLTRAITKASDHIFHSRDTDIRPRFNETDLDSLPPDIQIDLVGTRTPSPEEEPLFDWSANAKQYRFKAPADQQSTSIDTDFSINDFEMSERDNESICKNSNFEAFETTSKTIDFDEVRDFAKEYVKNIITSALESINSQTTDKNKSMIKNSRSDNQCFESGTWMTRIRQVFRQLMRSACLCKSKQQFRQRKS